MPQDCTVSLPSEAEWEKAARGGLDIPLANPVQTLPLSLAARTMAANPQVARNFPWEGDEEPERMNFAETGLGQTSPVGGFPSGASPYGVEELSGNVWEWTRSLWRDYPYDPSDGREDLKAPGPRVLRGGAFFSNARLARCAYRYLSNPDNRYDSFGFRVVVSPFFSDL